LRELAQERFPDDELAAKITAREAFNAEEAFAYATDLDAQVEEQGLEAAPAHSHASPGGASPSVGGGGLRRLWQRA
jgi:hypothetical protein